MQSEAEKLIKLFMQHDIKTQKYFSRNRTKSDKIFFNLKMVY